MGEPLPTGAFCPSLPHTPSQVPKSSAIASIALMTSIARPIRFAPRTGVPTWPFSIKNPSLTPNTKSPVAGLTCPPPSEVTHTPCSVASRMSPGLEEPLRMFVLVMRGTGGNA